MLASIAEKRKATVITLIHRQETMSFLGFPIMRHIDIDDAESVLRAIRGTESGRPIEIILHTPGGLVLAASQIAKALADHDGRVTAVVPHYAMSGGTLIALAADEILIDRHAALGRSTRSWGNIRRRRSSRSRSCRAGTTTRLCCSQTSAARRLSRSRRPCERCSSAAWSSSGPGTSLT